MTGPGSGTYEPGDWLLASGEVLAGARLGYRIWGEPNESRNNFVVLPTYYTGTHDSYAPIIGKGRALDPSRFCIVAVDVFGMGVSSSPSNASTDQSGHVFPDVSLGDSVKAQYQFLSDALGMRSIALVAGWSLAGIQACYWAAAWPDQVRSLLPWCASARCSPHNFAFLDGVRAALMADSEFREGRYKSPPAAGLAAFGRVYCSWAFSQDFFRKSGWNRLGHATLEELLDSWAREHVEQYDANDLLTVLRAWQNANLGDWLHTDFEAALSRIRARTILMPSRTDLYFPPEDNVLEARHIPDAEVRIVDTDWGHVAGGPGRDPVFGRQLETALAELLAD